MIQPKGPGCTKKFTLTQSVSANWILEVSINGGVCWYLHTQQQMELILCLMATMVLGSVLTTLTMFIKNPKLAMPMCAYFGLEGIGMIVLCVVHLTMILKYSAASAGSFLIVVLSAFMAIKAAYGTYTSSMFYTYLKHASYEVRVRAAKCAEEGLAAKREWKELKAMKEKNKPKETVNQMENLKKKPKPKPKNVKKTETHVVMEGLSTDGNSDSS